MGTTQVVGVKVEPLNGRPAGYNPPFRIRIGRTRHRTGIATLTYTHVHEQLNGDNLTEQPRSSLEELPRALAENPIYPSPDD